MELVARLRADAATAEGHVRAVTGLGHGLPLLPADVVDRPAWAGAALSGMAALTAGRAAAGRREGRARGHGAHGRAAARRGASLTSAAGCWGSTTRSAAPDGDGRLLLVAPNVHAAQQALDVSSDDFGLWVCLHEATHRLQFTAVPWLRSYFADEVSRLLSLAGDSRPSLDRLPELFRTLQESKGDSLAVVELLQGPEQRAVLDRLLALTTLLEGHADHVMDAVGPEVVPTVETIRARFTIRRRGGGLVDRVLRALLGVEAKVRQYAVGLGVHQARRPGGGDGRVQQGVGEPGDGAHPRGARQARRLAAPGAQHALTASLRFADGESPFPDGESASGRRVAACDRSP